MATSIYLGNPPPKIKEWIIADAERKYQEMLKTPLHFIAEEPNAKMRFYVTEGTYETSPTGEEGSWTPYNSEDTITLANIGDKVYFRASNDKENFNARFNRFDIKNGKIAANGNIQFLLDNTGTEINTTGHCYEGMFSGCTSLTQAPALPATTLADYCYWNMFNGCTSLTKAPALPAMTLADNCYE
jgi:hypothetical protein